ncbi:TRAP transporter substrate-binding protein DctP [Ramlibacter terrae]|uniref:TRAP transporter substrate-binding protein DctP n=1 Tax=Ramlibacter terrae TaxID=2732511 RepID=A0ABX6P204_9BURK|nr:TRAP transporter substrate-binding protein DctP [Ramlibacter terrae]
MALPAPFARRAGAACLAVAALLATAGAAAADNWRAYTYNAVATVTAVKGLNAMIEDVQKATQGQLQIRLNLAARCRSRPPTSRRPSATTWCRWATTPSSWAACRWAASCGCRCSCPARRLREGLDVQSEYLRPEFAKRNIVLLGRYIFPENVFWSKKKMTSLADIAGQKIRVVSPEQAEFIKLLGGIPVTLGTSEVAAGLDRGVIDGALTASSGYGYVWRDLLKYSYRLNVSFVDSLIMVNKDAWDKLTPDTRAKVQALVNEHTAKMTAAMLAEDKDLTAKLAAGGMVVTEPSAADLAEAERRITPYWKEWGEKRPAAREALQKVRTAVGR